MSKQRIFLKYGIQLTLIRRKIRDILPVKDHTPFIRCLESSQNTKCSSLSTSTRTK